jgi:hypothetical protein
MNNAVTWALVGLAVAVLLVAVEYLAVRKGATERAVKAHTKVQWTDTERKRVRSIAVFAVWIPPVFAACAWLLS